jgi:hypothetical protein
MVYWVLFLIGKETEDLYEVMGIRISLRGFFVILSEQKFITQDYLLIRTIIKVVCGLFKKYT